MWSTVCTVVRVRAEVQVFGRGLLWTLRGLQRMQRALRPGGARSSAVIHFLFRLALCLSSVIMAALKHYQPCLRIWNPKVSYLPVYSLHRLPPLPPHRSSAAGHTPVSCAICGDQGWPVLLSLHGETSESVVWVMLPHFPELTWINQRKMTFWDETMHVRF